MRLLRLWVSLFESSCLSPLKCLLRRSILSDLIRATLGVLKESDLRRREFWRVLRKQGGGVSARRTGDQRSPRSLIARLRILRSARQSLSLSANSLSTSWLLIVEPRLEVVDGVDEAAVSNGDREVDGVKIRLAVKTASEIRSRVHGRLRFAAQRTDEDELVVSSLVGPTQFFEQPSEVDFVTQATQ